MASDGYLRFPHLHADLLTFVADDDVWLAPADGGRVTDIAAAPDGMTVAVAARDGRLLAVDVASGQVTELAASADGEVTGLAYSPDSGWLAWAQPGPRPLSRIRIARLRRSPIRALCSRSWRRSCTPRGRWG